MNDIKQHQEMQMELVRQDWESQLMSMESVLKKRRTVSTDVIVMLQAHIKNLYRMHERYYMAAARLEVVEAIRMREADATREANAASTYTRVSTPKQIHDAPKDPA